MALKVEPEALYRYAGQLADALRAAEAAKVYVNRWGTFSNHEKGMLGMVWPNHARYLSQINAMLNRLAELTDASGAEMHQQARHYANTDMDVEARVDATYPSAPRASITRD